MMILNYISDITSIDSKYWILIFKTLIFWITLYTIKKICIKIIVKKVGNQKKEYLYTQKIRYLILMSEIFVFILYNSALLLSKIILLIRLLIET